MNRRDFLLKSGAAVSLGLFAKGPLSAQVPASGPGPAPAPSVPVQAPTLVTEFKPLRRNVGYFTGRGGSIGWLVNPTAVVAVDTQFPDTAAIFLKELPGRSGRMLDVVINTHHHGDHTGGNGIFRPESRNIVAQANVPGLIRAAAQRNHPPTDEKATAALLPNLLFPTTWRFDSSDETISARYFGPAHTNGDIAVHFERANVVHLGDLVFNRIYPVIDRPGGASIRHWVTVLEEMAAAYPKDAVFVFGHGNAKFGVTGGTADLLVFRDYLSALLAYVAAGIKAGRSKEEVQKLENLAGFPDFHVPAGRGNRLPANLSVAYDELTGA